MAKGMPEATQVHEAHIFKTYILGLSKEEIKTPMD